MIDNKLHKFDYEGNACLVNTPNPPRHWYNYMWSEDGYCAQVSQIGHGRSYYLNEKADMCMVNNNDARYIYIRDDEDNTSGNIGEGPMNIEVDKYESTHHIGYTEIKSEKNKMQAN